MPQAEFACPKCKTAFAVEPGTVDAAVTCPGCASELQGHFFSAFFRPVESGMLASALTDQTEAGCFYHPQKQAVRVCDGCGRLICALCSIDLGGEHLCPACISSGKKKGRITTLENSRTRYDNLALSLAILGIVTCYFSLILSPVAIYLIIRHWNSPRSLVGSSRVKIIVALVLAVASLAFWVLMLGLIFLGKAVPNHHHP